jgi:large subunit ribosomal protein L7/L12
MNKQEIIDAIKQMSVMDLADLVKTLEQEFGVSAAAPVAVAAAPAAGAAPAAAAAPAAEEQTEFDVILKETGPDKIKVIKVVRELTGLGLRESKEAVDGAPSTIRKAVSKEEAQAAKAKLEEVGAVVEVK